MVYGPNGAGKSNLVRALSTLQALVVEGRVPPRETDGVRGLHPFRLVEGDGACRFEIELVARGRHFSYGLVVSRAVEDEWLYEKGPQGERAVFHRAIDEDWPSTLSMDPSVLPAAQALARNLPAERLFLSACGESGLGECVLAREGIVEIVRDDRFEGVKEDVLLCFPAALEHVYGLLRDAGVGDAEIQFTVGEGVVSTDRARLADAGIQVGRPHPAEAFPTWVRDEWIPITLVMVRRTPSGQPVVFALEDESDGTRRLIELGGWHWDVGRQALGIVDEIERSLHPLVVRQIVAGIVGKPGNGQLVCTTHDSNLLDRTMLPADSIWFAQKGPDGATKLYSLAEFDPEQLAILGNDLERGYLNGRFGAIPFVGDTRRLGWAK